MAVDLSRVAAAGHRAFGRDATYRAPDGATMAITVVLSRPDVDTGLFQTGTIAATVVADIQTVDVPQVLAGAELKIEGETFEVLKPMRDPERLVWRCPLRKVANG